MTSSTFAGKTLREYFPRMLSTNRQSTNPPIHDLIDVNALIGPYPFRQVPHPDPEILDRVVQRDGLEGAWVGHLPSAFHRDPSQGNEELFRVLEKLPKLSPVPTIRPDWPKWTESLKQAKAKGAVAVRAYPQHWGMGPGDASMSALAVTAGKAR